MTAPLTLASMQALMDRSPFIAFCGMTVTALEHDPDRASIRMPLRPELRRGGEGGHFHGGAIAGLIDVAGDMALALGLGGGIPTINLRVDYLRPGSGDALTAHATARRAGRTIGVVDIDVLDEQHRLVAIGRGTYSMNVG